MIPDAPAVLLSEDNPDDDEELTLRGQRNTNLSAPVDVTRDGQEALDYLFRESRPKSESLSKPAVLLDLRPPRAAQLGVYWLLTGEPAPPN